MKTYKIFLEGVVFENGKGKGKIHFDNPIEIKADTNEELRIKAEKIITVMTNIKETKCQK